MKINLEFNPLDKHEVRVALSLLSQLDPNATVLSTQKVEVQIPETTGGIKEIVKIEPEKIAEPTKPAKPVKAAAPPVETKEPSINIETLKNLTSAKLQAGHKEAVKAKLKELNSSNVSSLPKEYWDRFKTFLEGLEDE